MYSKSSWKKYRFALFSGGKTAGLTLCLLISTQTSHALTVNNNLCSGLTESALSECIETERKERTAKLTKEEQRQAERDEREQEERAAENQRRESENLRREEERERTEERERVREQRDTRKERREQIEENRKEREEKCEQAEKDMKEEKEDKKTEKETWEEKFYDQEEEITKLNNQNSENQLKLSESLEDIKKTTGQNIQELKDQMGEEIKDIDAQVTQLEDEMEKLHDGLAQVEEMRLSLFVARRKQQNEFYSKCFGQALTQTETERAAFYQRAKAKTLKRKSSTALMKGGKKSTKNTFSSRFNKILHQCLHGQEAILQKKNEENEYKLAEEKIHRQEQRMKAKRIKVQAQIENMKTNSKVEVMKRFKEKMEKALSAFDDSYNSLTKKYNQQSKQVIDEIGKIKEKQAYFLMNRSKAVPQKTRNALISNQCQGADQFNLYPSSTNKGLFNSSSDYEEEYGVGTSID